MPDFRVVLASQPEKYFEKTDAQTAERLQDCFEHLEKNPLFSPGKIKKVQGRGAMFRYRVGGLCVIYEVDMQHKKVNVLAIFPRGDVYKKI